MAEEEAEKKSKRASEANEGKKNNEKLLSLLSGFFLFQFFNLHEEPSDVMINGNEKQAK